MPRRRVGASGGYDYYGNAFANSAMSTSRLSAAAAESGVSSAPAAAAMKEEVDPGVVDGTELRIVKYPHPALRAKNEEVTAKELKDGSISKLAKEMFLVM